MSPKKSNRAVHRTPKKGRHWRYTNSNGEAIKLPNGKTFMVESKSPIYGTKLENLLNTSGMYFIPDVNSANKTPPKFSKFDLKNLLGVSTYAQGNSSNVHTIDGFLRKQNPNSPIRRTEIKLETKSPTSGRWLRASLSREQYKKINEGEITAFETTFAAPSIHVYSQHFNRFANKYQAIGRKLELHHFESEARDEGTKTPEPPSKRFQERYQLMVPYWKNGRKVTEVKRWRFDGNLKQTPSEVKADRERHEKYINFGKTSKRLFDLSPPSSPKKPSSLLAVKGKKRGKKQVKSLFDDLVVPTTKKAKSGLWF